MAFVESLSTNQEEAGQWTIWVHTDNRWIKVWIVPMRWIYCCLYFGSALVFCCFFLVVVVIVVAVVAILMLLLGGRRLAPEFDGEWISEGHADYFTVQCILHGISLSVCRFTNTSTAYYWNN